jgi:hypothetical protein
VSTKKIAFTSRGSNLRVSGMMVNYFRTDNSDTGAINCFTAICYVESVNATSDHDGNDGVLFSGFSGATMGIAGTMSITNTQLIRANAKSTWQFYTPAGEPTVTFTHNGTGLFPILANESSHGFASGGTFTFTGTGTYPAFMAFTGSTINFNGDAAAFGSAMNITVNGANITFLHADTGSMISEGCGGSGTTCTFTSMLRRAYARNNSFIKYSGTTTGTSADFTDGGSRIATGTFPQDVTQVAKMTAHQPFGQISAPGTVPSNEGFLYVKDVAGTTGLFFKDDAQAEVQLGAGGGGSPSIGGTLTSGTGGSVLFSGSAVFAQDNTNFFYDDTNNILKLGNPSSATNYRLQLKGSGGFDGLFMVNEGNSMLMRQEVYSSTQAFHAPQFGTVRGRGTIASPAAVVSGDLLYQIDASGQETTTTQNTAARISITADGTPGTNDMPGRIELGTTADGAASPTTRVRIQANGLTSLYSGAAVASAATITPTGNSFHVTGTTNITSVSGTGVTAGTTITIIFDGALTFTDGSNLKLAGNFVTTADDTITLVYDGTNWYETARAVN